LKDARREVADGLFVGNMMSHPDQQNNLSALVADLPSERG
jgi:hypothetical protein